VSNETIVAITGASGAIYGIRLIERLLAQGERVHLLVSQAGREVLAHELGLELAEDVDQWPQAVAQRIGCSAASLRAWADRDWFSPVASGSAGIARMAIVPCSMGTLARIAHGASTNLIERAADVMLKEHRRLVLVPRETPLSSIHLRNMLALAEAGARIAPASPGFYHRPQRIEELVDFVVDRVLAQLGFADAETRRWGSEKGVVR